MTRSRALLGCAAVAVMVALGFPSLTAMASDGTEPPTTESAGADDAEAPTGEMASAPPVSSCREILIATPERVAPWQGPRMMISRRDHASMKMPGKADEISVKEGLASAVGRRP